MIYRGQRERERIIEKTIVIQLQFNLCNEICMKIVSQKKKGSSKISENWMTEREDKITVMVTAMSSMKI